MSKWGWPDLAPNWNWPGQEGRMVRVVAYSAGEVELVLNKKSLGRKAAGPANRFAAVFDLLYEPGLLEAISYQDGAVLSRNGLITSGPPAALRLHAETASLRPDGRSLAYVTAVITDANNIRGRCLAVIRSGYEPGAAVLTVNGEGIKGAELRIPVEGCSACSGPHS